LLAIATIVWLTIAIIAFLLVKFDKKSRHAYRFTIARPNLIALLILLVTVLLLHFNVPAKAGFMLSYSGFQEAVAALPDRESKDIGLYKIEAMSSVTQQKEGIYFLVHTYFDTVTANYGFVYQPNLKQDNADRSDRKAPFGAYEYKHIVNDWYIFHGATC
jgi:hypothetical protein